MLRDIVAKREKELPASTIGSLIKIAEEDKKIISLGPGEPDFPSPPNVIRAAKRSLDRKETHYSPPAGRQELIEALAKKLKRENGIDASEENIIVTSGSTEGILLTLLSAMDDGEGVLLPDPGFLAYKPAVEVLDGNPIHYHLDGNFEPDMGHLEDVIGGGEKTKLLILNTPSNPTGSVFSRKRMEELADFVIEHDLLALSDEAYERFVFEGARHVSLASLNGMENNAISVFSFSKTYAMPGFRIGYAVGRQDVISAMRKLHIFSTICAPTIGQVAAIEALSRRSERYVSMMLDEYDKRRRLILKLIGGIEGFECNRPKGAFYIFPSIAGFNMGSMKLASMLLRKASVAVVPGVEFGSHGEGHVRMSYASSAGNIKKAMGRIEAFAGKMRK